MRRYVNMDHEVHDLELKHTDYTDVETQVTDERKVEDIYIFPRSWDPDSNKYVMEPPNIDCIIVREVLLRSRYDISKNWACIVVTYRKQSR